MFSVLLIWLYVLPVSWIIGFVSLKGVSKCLGTDRDKRTDLLSSVRVDGCVIAGFIALTIYAQSVSLFSRVGLVANLFLLAACGVIICFYYKEMLSLLEKSFRETGKGRLVLFFLLFFLFAYGTSGGILHYDTSLYHAQSIRWLEEYGVVKGLGNLHNRLAYNSAAFSLSALFSFSFLGKGSFHAVAGLLAFLLAKVCGEWKVSSCLKLSGLARLMGVYYVLIIFDEMVSPASDYFMVLLVFYLIIRWLDLMERGEEKWLLYGLLCLLGVFVMSVKLSAALILLLTIKPAVMLVREKNYRAIFVFLGFGIVILAPFLIRNYLISGWLVYPFTFPDLFQADWKIPEHIALYDSREIKVWGRGMTDMARYRDGISQWFGNWFRAKTSVDKLFIGGALAGLPCLTVMGTLILVQKKKRYYDWLLMALAVELSFVFWLLTAPLIRYGCVYVWLAPCLVFGIFLSWIKEKGILQKAVLFGIIVVSGYKLLAFAGEIPQAAGVRNLIWQQPYEEFETISYEIGGITFYIPAEGDRAGYSAFPSSPEKAGIRLRGTEIKEGFTSTRTDGR